MSETKHIPFFTPEEHTLIEELKGKLHDLAGDCLRPEDKERMTALLTRSAQGHEEPVR